jgi:hypothetical protein
MSQSIIDEPISLSYSNGKLFPSNGIFTSYILFAVGLLFSFQGAWMVGLPMMILSSFVILSNYGVQFDRDGTFIREYINYFGFIKISKRFETTKWTYVTVLPGKSTNTLFSRSTNYINQTNYFYQICLLNERYGHKKELINLSSKPETEALAKSLAQLLQLNYFEYDPAVIRASYRRKL